MIVKDLAVGEEYMDEEGKIWLGVTENLVVENTPITIEEALKDPDSITGLFNIGMMLLEEEKKGKLNEDNL